MSQPPTGHSLSNSASEPVSQQVCQPGDDRGGDGRIWSRRRRTWVIITVALWLAAIVTLIIVLMLWRTSPLQPVQLG